MNESSPIKPFADLPINLKYQIMYQGYLKQIVEINFVMGEGYLKPMSFDTWMEKKKEHWDWELPKES